MVEIYTDGTSLGNPGKGAYAVLILLNNQEIILAKGYKKTTNNRMELMAFVEAMNFLKNNNIKEGVLFTDSQLISKAINEGWLRRWSTNGWKTSNKTTVLNIDIWEKVNYLLNFVKINVKWIEGHRGNKFNEMVDKIAKKIAKTDAIEIDYEYEQKSQSV